MAEYAELEIGLHRWDTGGYVLDLRGSQPDSDAEVRPDQNGQARARFDTDRLLRLEDDPDAYGRLLAENLLADPSARAIYSQATSVADSLGVPLRLRLAIGATAMELHGLHWEALRDPDSGASLVTSERLLFSRYLSSQDWRRVRLRARGDLKALVMIANPSGLDQWEPDGRPLAPVDVAGELDRAKKGLGDIPVTALASGGAATLNNLTERLREGFDILYLVCHGALIDDEPRLWLEDAGGQVAQVPGAELATRLRELPQLPRLAVLSSCQSAGGSSDGGALSAVGPRLAEAGLPAVLAMQGNVTMETVASFVPVLFRELLRDGQIDRAVAAARGAIRERDDSWVPVLFMRLKSGRLWYQPGFAGDQRDFEKWPTLLDSIRAGHCTPILGPGIAEALLGSRREMARRWADTYRFPLAFGDRDGLPQVAQYLAVNQAPIFPQRELLNHLRQEMVRFYGGELPAELRGAPLNAQLTAMGARLRDRDENEPHKVLARFPFPLFVTTSPSSVLADALRAAGKQPRAELCRWSEYLESEPSIYDQEPDFRPTEQQPLIYHIFGHLDDPDSLVLTEDDYFDFLIGLTRRRDQVPTVVGRALNNSALLFLGFQMDDWNFRVLFRSIMSLEGRELRRRYAHVAVQVDPEEDHILDPERARKYLESYFGHANISVYWGSAEDFLKDLQRQDQTVLA